MLRIILLILLGGCLLSSTFANESPCISVPFKIDGKTIILPGAQNPKSSVVYFFQNKSLQSVWIDHADPKRRGMGAGWASYLRPGNWSALILNKKNFNVSCSMIQPGKVETLDCSKTLSICTPQNLVSATPLEGNVWLVEDKKWDSFLHILEKKQVTFTSKQPLHP